MLPPRPRFTYRDNRSAVSPSTLTVTLNDNLGGGDGTLFVMVSGRDSNLGLTMTPEGVVALHDALTAWREKYGLLPGPSYSGSIV